MASREEPADKSTEEFISPQDLTEGEPEPDHEPAETMGPKAEGMHPSAAPQTVRPGLKANLKTRLSRVAHTKKIAAPLAVLLVVGVVLAVPFTRYKVLGLAIKHPMDITVLDQTTGRPVTDATVELAGRTAKTDQTGHVKTAKLPPGKHTVKITKKFYTDFTGTLFVPITGNTQLEFKTKATGRQVMVSVKNKIGGKVLENVLVKSGESEARTDKTGVALIVLPDGQARVKATFSLDGFNSTEYDIKVMENRPAENVVNLTPAGSLYFLSKQTGKIDVVKTNLDGTNRQTVLAGTGKEDEGNTTLLASRDWKFLALKARRESAEKLYLIDTATDKLSIMDEGKAAFFPTGWDGHTFIYTVTRTGYGVWQPKAAAIKSFNADSQKLTTLDETSAEGSPGDYAGEQYGQVYAFDGMVMYDKGWNFSYPSTHASGKQNQIFVVKTGGEGKKSLKGFPLDDTASEVNYVESKPYEPKGIYYAHHKGTTTTYYELEGGGIKEAKDLTDGDFRKAYATYLLSPNGRMNFWSDSRDGKNTLFVGDEDGQNEKQVGTLGGYTQYGWYTDEYLLASKDSSELYIFSRDGLTSSELPLKVSDYHKPDLSYIGYGGGYGGL